MAYSGIGRFRDGVWLIVKGNETYIVPRSKLPPQGSGWKYYWLGASTNQVQPRLFDALDKLGAQDPQGAGWTGRDFTPQITTALHGGIGSFGSRIGFLQKVLNAAGSAGVPAPSAVTAAGAGGLGAGAGAGAGDAGAAGAAGAGGGLSTAGKAGLLGITAAAITSPLDFLKFIAWIFHPRNILRAVEFLTGIAVMAFGVHAAMQARGEKIEGFSTSEGALTRSGLGRVATALGRSVREDRAERRPSTRRRRVRVQSAPHRTRRQALRQRYEREENLRRRKARN